MSESRRACTRLRPVTSPRETCSKIAPVRDMPDILLIKTSSLGDVIHQMPALTEARRRLPQARFSWVVEEAFAPLVRLHPDVDDVIAVATRRWRERLFAPRTGREIAS